MNTLTNTEQKYILETFFDSTNHITNTQINSFNNFINYGLSNIITGEEINIELKDKRYVLRFGNVYVTEPHIIDNQTSRPLFPYEARRRDLNYDGNVTCDVTEEIIENNKIITTRNHTKVVIAKLPIMLLSNKCNLHHLTKKERIEKQECELDVGGYFIIKGNERVILGQIRADYNKCFISYKHDKTKEFYIANVRSISEQTSHSVSVSIKMNIIDKKTYINLPYIDTQIPLGVVYKAYGMDSNDIKTLIGISATKAEPYIYSILSDASKYSTKDDAIRFISTQLNIPLSKDKQVAYVEQILDNEIFPHISIISKPIHKIYFISRIVNKLLSTIIGLRKGYEHERDNFSNKRIETTGVLCYDLFNSLFKRYLNAAKLQLEKKKENISIINNLLSNIPIITTGMRYSFSTGNWGVKKNAYIRTGVSQVLSRLTYPATISHLRRIVCPIGGKETPVKIRQINGSQFGYMCPSETPEGETAGVVLNLALTCDITNTIPSILVKEALQLLQYEPLELKNLSNTKVTILLNEDAIGLTDKPLEFVKQFKELRKNNFIHQLVSIAYDYIDREIRICSDRGRCVRPLLINTPEPPKQYNWNYLLQNNYIQYVDCNEIEWSYVAMHPQDLKEEHDYCEIHPITQLGNVASCIPFPNHSQAPRNVYQSSMGKQALGMYSMVYKKRTDTNSYVMWYPQRPLVTSMTSEFMNCNKMPSGIQCIVMIGCLEGYNQEDSLIMNKNSIERGLFVTTSYKTITEIEKKKCIYTSEIICVPPLTNNKKIGEPGAFKRTGNNYNLLDQNGIVRVGAYVKKGDVILGKVITKSSKGEIDIMTDCSTSIKSGEEGHIDQVYTDYTVDGQKIIKIVIRQLKYPEPGDKFAARSAQKGTVCLIRNQEDMPFTQSGLIPDIIINPHCFVGSTLVTLPNGLAKRIDKLNGSGGETVLCLNKNVYDEKDNIIDKDTGIVKSKSLGLIPQGIRETIKLVMEDGREIECTPDHKFVVKNGDKIENVEAQHLTEKHMLILGPDGTEDKEYDDEKGWKLKTLNWVFTMKNQKERNKTLAFARLVGFVLTDGTIHPQINKDGVVYYKVRVCLGCDIDVQNLFDDIALITDHKHSITRDEYTFNIQLSGQLAQTIGNLDNITSGRRTTQNATIPAFITDDKCPKAVLREFLAGMFGGDGWSPYLLKNDFSTVSFSKSICVEFEQSNKDRMQTICNLLKKLNVDANVGRTRNVINEGCQSYTDRPRSQTELCVESNIAFLENVGFRYCIQKTNRLSIACSYQRLKENVMKQHNDMINIVNLYTKTGKSVVQSIELARQEYAPYAVPLNTYYSLLTKTQVENRKRKNRNNELTHFSYRFFPTATQFLELQNCLKWFKQTDKKINYFVGREDTVIPFLSIRVKGILKTLKPSEVYDITVDKFHNFFSCGVLAFNCIPSRMTVNQLLECVLGKSCALSGEYGDCTAFSDSPNIATEICDKLSKFGFEKNGNEWMTNGMTGEMFKTDVFIGPTFYQRLKHIVKNKMHARSIGHVTTSTRQPLEGRSRDGGLRHGEMERDCMIAHGAASFLDDRLYKNSDPFQINVCNTCGHILSSDICSLCGKNDKIRVKIPYACKSLIQQLQSMSLKLMIKGEY